MQEVSGGEPLYLLVVKLIDSTPSLLAAFEASAGELKSALAGHWA